MKKNNWTLLLFLLLGVLAGAIFTMLLASVESFDFFTNYVELNWEPKANLQVIQYDIQMKIQFNLLSLIGIIGAYFLYRRL